MTLLSALSGGLWIIPLGFLLLSIWSFYRTYKAWKSGSGRYEGKPPKWVWNDVKISLFSIGAFWYGVAFLALSIGAYLWMRSEQ